MAVSAMPCGRVLMASILPNSHKCRCPVLLHGILYFPYARKMLQFWGSRSKGCKLEARLSGFAAERRQALKLILKR